MSETQDAAQPPQYRSHKQVGALRILGIEIGSDQRGLISFHEPGFAPIMCEPKMFSRYMPVQGDYLVFYEDGYQSFSPKKAFEDGYTRIM
jgi:hypothetical protein